MKHLFWIIFLLPMALQAQKMPVTALNSVRITQPEKVIVAETIPFTSTSKQSSSLWYYWYSANEIHITQGGYSGKALNGNYNEYYLNKNLKEKGQFEKGLKTGIWKNWRQDGSLASAYTWKAGQRYGDFFVYDEQGKLLTSGIYKNDLLNGKIFNHIGADSVESTRYKDGKIVPVKKDTVSFLRKLNIFRKRHKVVDSTKRSN
jgi:hypothetical protein